MHLDYKTVYASTSLMYVPETGTYLWDGYMTDYTCGLWEIDPVNKQAYQLCEYDARTTLDGFFLLDAAVSPMPISAPELDSYRFSFADNCLTNTYFLPSAKFSGEEISGAMDWTTLVDGVPYTTGSGEAGSIAEVKFNDLEFGNHKFEFYVEAQGMRSPCDVLVTYVGADTPLPTEFVEMKDSKITWAKVTRCENDGYLDPDFFCRVFINDEEIATTRETSIDYVIPTDEPFRAYIASVEVDNCGVLSKRVSSESIQQGLPWELDTFILPTKADALACVAMSGDGDKKSWAFWDEVKYNDEVISCFGSSSTGVAENAADWMFLPPMNFDDPNATYEIEYDAGNFSLDYSPVYFSILLTSELDPKKEVATLQERRGFINDNTFNTYPSKFMVPEAGTYYVVLFHDNKTWQSGIRVRNIHVRKITGSDNVPEPVALVSAEGAPLGELKAILNVTLPSKYISGEEIPSDKEITVKAESACGTVSLSGKPGDSLTLEIPTNQGDNEISLTTYEGDVEGKTVTVVVFTGIDVPGPVTSMTGFVSEDNLSMTVYWDKPEGGENGHYINPHDVEYYLMEYDYNDGWVVIDNLGKNVFEYTAVVAEGSPLATKRVGIAPVTISGRSSTINYMSDVLGTPYQLPMFEDHADYQVHYTPLRVVTPGEQFEDGFVCPRAIDPNMANESDLAAYFRCDIPDSHGVIMMPKFTTEGCSDAGVIFNVWTGYNCAETTILAEVFGMDKPVEIGAIKRGDDCWRSVEVRLPDYMQNQRWVTIYLDSYFETTDQYFLYDWYHFKDGVSSVDYVMTENGTVYSDGGVLHADGFEGSLIGVYTLDGCYVGGTEKAPASWSISLRKGVYIVRCGAQSVKIFVKFDLPEQVDKEENIAVAAILLDGKNGKVVSGDEVSASDFNRDLSGTDTVLEDRDNISVDTEGSWIVAKAPVAGYAYVYAADGSLVYAGDIAAGRNVIPAEGLKGMLVVRIVCGGRSAVRKIVI